MKRFFTTLLAVVLFSISMWGQDTIKTVIISEVRWDGWAGCYVEFTNMGTDTVDMSEFVYGNVRSSEWVRVGDEVNLLGSEPGTTGVINEEDTKFRRLEGRLAPGASMVAMIVNDAANIYTKRSLHPVGLVERCSMFNHASDGYNVNHYFPYHPEWEMWGFDSTDSDTNWSLWINHRPTNESGVLFWTSGDENGDTLSALVDQVILDIDWSTGRRVSGAITVAGVPEANETYNLYRKFTVKKGETDWAKARGDTPENSQWMLIPHGAENGMVRETEGNHGDFSIEVSSSICTIGDGSISVPWGTQKFDSIRPLLTLGQGMSWWYLENSSFEDSLSTVCKTGDTLVLYAVGNDLEVGKYAITVEDAPGNMVNVYPKRNTNYVTLEDGNIVPLTGNVPYEVKEYDGIIDSIVGVTYATKVDTMLSRLEIAPDASWEIIYAAGENNEISTGDILRVTGSDGSTTKDYYIRTDEYSKSDNVDLAGILWPDKPAYIIEGWIGDTIPNFAATGVNYNITLPLGWEGGVPALVVSAEDLNADVTVDRAISLSGGTEERTTIITVNSEDGEVVRTIKVLFNVPVDESLAQKYIGDPIFSKFIWRHYYSMGAIELVNPSDELIDLSNYMIVQADETSPGEAIATLNDPDSLTTWLKRYKKYVPGYKWQTSDLWALNPGILQLDTEIDPYLESKDVFVIWQPHDQVNKGKTDDMFLTEGRADLVLCDENRVPEGFEGIYWNPWNEPIQASSTDIGNIAYPLFPTGTGASKSNYYLFKIINPDVKSGVKNVYDPLDFELVDAFGSPNDAPWQFVNTAIGSKPMKTNRHVRLPHSYYGASHLGDLLDTDWDYINHNMRDSIPEANATQSPKAFGQHTLAPITAHKSTVSSLVYLVDPGFEGDLSIYGVSNSETVQALLNNLIPADAAQDISVLSAAATDTLDLTDVIGAGDTLQVISVDGTAMTKYILSVIPLSDDAVLTAVDGSGLVVDAALTDSTGTVGGFTFGLKVREILDNVNVPDKAILNVVDSLNQLVPLQRYNTDTVYVDLVATSAYYLEVIAENGKKIIYQLLPDADDLYVLSDIYTVYEDPTKSINQVLGGTAVQSFINNVYTVEGASMKIITITGQHRTIGNVSVDDILEVSSEDGSVTIDYEITFIGEQAAYVTSSVFEVDQLVLTIKVDEGTSVEALLAGLTPAADAVTMVKDVNGDVKSTGEVLATDVVVVTSGDGINTVTYSIDLIISVYNDLIDNLRVFPNPTVDILHVENVPADTYVRIRDISGRTHFVSQASDISSGIDLGGMNTGMYFLTIEKDRKALATVKFIKN